MINAIDSDLQVTAELLKASDDYIQPALSKLKKASEDFEAIFLQQMLQLMRRAGPQSDLFDSGFASDVYEGMMDEQLANEITKDGSFGLASLMYDNAEDSAIATAIDEYKQSKVDEQ